MNVEWSPTALSGKERMRSAVQISPTRTVLRTSTGSHEYVHAIGTKSPRPGTIIQRWLDPDGTTIAWWAQHTSDM